MTVRDHELTFSGAGVLPIQAVGKFLRVLESASPVYIQVDGGTDLKRNAGGVVNMGDNFRDVRIRSGVAQDVLVVTSQQEQTDSSKSVSVTTSATVENGNQNNHLPKVTVADSSTTLLASAKAGRKALRVAVPSDAAGSVSLGRAGMVANEGGLLEAGMIDYIDTEGELYARNDSGAAVDVWVMEVNKV